MSDISRKRAVLLGDYTEVEYHPLEGVDNEIKKILKDNFIVTCTEDYSILLQQNLKNFDLCILYVDCWNRTVPKEFVEGLISYVEQGGGLLIIHTGVALQSDEDFIRLVGGKFTGHPPYTKIKVMAAAAQHEIVKGLPDFEVEDEPYRFEFEQDVEKEIIMEYLHEESIYPAGWVRKAGKGRIVYIMPGHNAEPFANEVYRQIVLRSANWAK